MAELIAATTAAATSGDFSSTGATTVLAYGMNKSEFAGYIEVKNSAGGYEPLMGSTDPSKAPSQVGLDGIVKSVVVIQPGTFRFQKPATVGTVGIDTEEA